MIGKLCNLLFNSHLNWANFAALSPLSLFPKKRRVREREPQNCHQTFGQINHKFEINISLAALRPIRAMRQRTTFLHLPANFLWLYPWQKIPAKILCKMRTRSQCHRNCLRKRLFAHVPHNGTAVNNKILGIKLSLAKNTKENLSSKIIKYIWHPSCCRCCCCCYWHQHPDNGIHLRSIYLCEHWRFCSYKKYTLSDKFMKYYRRMTMNTQVVDTSCARMDRQSSKCTKINLLDLFKFANIWKYYI